MRGIHRWPVNSPHKWPVTRKAFPFDDVITARDPLNLWRSTCLAIIANPQTLCHWSQTKTDDIMAFADINHKCTEYSNQFKYTAIAVISDKIYFVFISRRCLFDAVERQFPPLTRGPLHMDRIMCWLINLRFDRMAAKVRVQFCQWNLFSFDIFFHWRLFLEVWLVKLSLI